MPKRGPETHQTKKGNQWYFGMKCHTGVDADSGFVHTVEATAADVHDVIAAAKLPGALINASLRAEIFRKKDKEIPQSLAALRDFLAPAL